LIVNNEEILAYLNEPDKPLLVKFEFRGHTTNQYASNGYRSFHEDPTNDSEFSYIYLTYLESEKSTELGLLQKPIDFSNTETGTDRPCQSVRFNTLQNPNTTLLFNNLKMIHRIPSNKKEVTYITQNGEIIDIEKIINLLGQRTEIQNTDRKTLLLSFNDTGNPVEEKEVFHQFNINNSTQKINNTEIKVKKDKIGQYFESQREVSEDGRLVIKVGIFEIEGGKKRKASMKRRQKASMKRRQKASMKRRQKASVRRRQKASVRRRQKASMKRRRLNVTNKYGK